MTISGSQYLVSMMVVGSVCLLLGFGIARSVQDDGLERSLVFEGIDNVSGPISSGTISDGAASTRQQWSTPAADRNANAEIRQMSEALPDSGISQGVGTPVRQNIGPFIDPDDHSTFVGDDSVIRVGEFLDPDELADAGGSKVHVGEFLDPDTGGSAATLN